jgi:hypothetical protein
MTETEYGHLELLLEKLRGEIGRYVINPCQLGELRHIGVYNSDGKLIKQGAGPTVKDAVANLKK